MGFFPPSPREEVTIGGHPGQPSMDLQGFYILMTSAMMDLGRTWPISVNSEAAYWARSVRDKWSLDPRVT
jgi:hypothetical protein